MPLQHTSTKIPGQPLFAVADWNANHVITGGVLDIGANDFIVDTNTLFVDAGTNRVGIGTATPIRVLNIYDENAMILFQNAASGHLANDGFQVGHTGTGLINAELWNWENGYIRFATNNAERMRILTGGNVGIGTTSPNEKLEVQAGWFGMSDTSITHPMTAIAATNTYGKLRTNDVNGTLRVIGLTETDAAGLLLQGVIGVANPTDTTPAVIFDAGKWNGGTSGAILTDAETAFQFQNWGTPIVTILGGGNVGIGTTTPLQLLHVEKSVDSGFVGHFYNTHATAGYGLIVRAGNDATNKILALRQQDSTEVFTALGDGRIGIGNIAPAASALLDLTSTTGALLLTRMTTAQRNALAGVNGMILYNTDTNKIEGYENGAWVEV